MTSSAITFGEPAKDWNEALPIGNGRMGAMIYGGVGTEVLQLNEDSLWYGSARDRVNPDAAAAIPKIREYLRSGEISKAEDLATFALAAIPEVQSHYEPLGNLYILSDHEFEDADSYSRTLDIASSIHNVEYSVGGSRYTRETVASYPDRVIAIRIRGAELNFHTQLARGNVTWDMRSMNKQIYRRPGYNSYIDEVRNLNGNTTIMTGVADGRGAVTYVCGIRVVTDGKLESIGSSLIVSGAKEAVIYVAAATSFYSAEPEKDVTVRLDAAAKKGYDAILKDHMEDYKALYDRVSLTLPSGEEDVVRMFNFGRYLMISGSREGSQPLNLQGIWNKDLTPMWDSKFTININTEMNYWPAEMTGLGECHMPLFDLIKRMYPRGREVARKMYGTEGFVAHHNTDIFGDCAPQDACLSSSYWVLGAAWLSLHIYEHYKYTNDISFLKEYIDIMLDAAIFIVNFLIPDKDGKYLVISPTISPENEYLFDDPSSRKTSFCLCEGCSMDDQIISELFDVCLDTADDLAISDDRIGQIKEARAKIRPVKLTRDGRIAEWHEDYEELDKGHRHISHLFGLFPGHSIRGDKELCDAARKTLEVRLQNGGGHTGWSRAWIINLYAALGDGNEAYAHIRQLMEKSLLPNLLDNHPPFQIDGNFGLTAGIANMILGEDGEFLPALPDNWKNGSIRGFVIRGGKRVDLDWEDGKVAYSKVY